jgi:alpha-tubulin suppressor-like RCC1 family protein
VSCFVDHCLSLNPFTAVKADGSITAWGDSKYGGSGAPSDNGYTKIYSNFQAFAALKANGSITAKGSPI